jgi:hypothetical protein
MNKAVRICLFGKNSGKASLICYFLLIAAVIFIGCGRAAKKSSLFSVNDIDGDPLGHQVSQKDGLWGYNKGALEYEPPTPPKAPNPEPRYTDPDFDSNEVIREVEREQRRERQRLSPPIGSNGSSIQSHIAASRRAEQRDIEKKKSEYRNLLQQLREEQSNVERIYDQHKSALVNQIKESDRQMSLLQEIIQSNEVLLTRAALEHNKKVDEIFSIKEQQEIREEKSKKENNFLQKTPPSTEEGHTIELLVNYSNYAQTIVENSSQYQFQRRELVNTANIAIKVADQSFAIGDNDEGYVASHIATQLLDLAISFTPGVGWGKDIYEAATGRNLVTHEKLDNFSWSVAIVGAVTGGIGSKIGKAIKVLKGIARSAEVAQDVKKVDKVYEVAEAASVLVKNKKEASEIVEVFEDFGRTGTAPLKEIASSAKEIGLDLRKIDVARFKNNPLNGTRYTNKVLDQMANATDRFHNFPKEIDNFAGLGKKTEIVGGDKIARTKIVLEGEYAGRKGTFEWIIEPDGSINHRKFEPL